MKRGDVVVVAAAGDYGKPRPAVVVQSDAIPDTHASVIVCQMTTTLEAVSDFRVDVEPDPGNGLRETSHIMADKPVTVLRRRIGQIVGRLSEDDLRRVDLALAFAVGLAD